MKKRILMAVSLIMITTLVLSACNLPLGILGQASADPAVIEETDPPSEPTEALTEAVTETSEPVAAVTEEPTEEATPEVTEEPAPTEEPPAGGDGTYGPTDFPEGINPLTGKATDPDLLKLPPALISVSNFPASARPQYGLNTSPMVFEITIGEGMTRFLAMFYGAFPEQVSGLTEGQETGSSGSSSGGDTDTGDSSGGSDSGDSGSGDDGMASAADASIGPIRSGRLPYEGIRSLFSGFLVMASAYSGVAQTLSDTTTIYGSDSDDINSALIDVSQLYNIALARSQVYPGSNFNLEGMKFSPDIPEGGANADMVWVFYNNLNQIQWRYDAELGAYVRYDIKTDGSGEFVMSTDRLDGKPIARENVIVLYAPHTYYAPTLIDITLTNMPPLKAMLFRDGQAFEIFWTSKYGDYEKETGLLRPIRYVDANGDPVALKNGNTWVEVLSMSSFTVESEISEYPFFPIKEAEGTGLWLVRYKGTY